MKDKPLSFQIWLMLTVFSVLMTIVVSFTTIIVINDINGSEINIFDPNFLFSQIRLIICIMIVCIIIAKEISNRITEPIRYLEKRVRLITSKKKLEIIKLDRKDEIGKLAYSIGKMQEDLEKMDQEEQFFLQSLSHELKTPIMVIKNYCQALRDGIYINRSIESTVDVIEDEVSFLENKITKMLYVESLDYVLEKERVVLKVDLRNLLDNLADRICRSRTDVRVFVTGNPVYFHCIEEKIQVALGNILENSMRYAKSFIELSVTSNHGLHGDRPNEILISITNDGDNIPPDIKKHLFDKFHKGKGGNFGLGLFITKKIVEFHKGSIWCENLEGGVRFSILFSGPS